MHIISPYVILWKCPYGILRTAFGLSCHPMNQQFCFAVDFSQHAVRYLKRKFNFWITTKAMNTNINSVPCFRQPSIDRIYIQSLLVVSLFGASDFRETFSRLWQCGGGCWQHVKRDNDMAPICLHSKDFVDWKIYFNYQNLKFSSPCCRYKKLINKSFLKNLIRGSFLVRKEAGDILTDFRCLYL